MKLIRLKIPSTRFRGLQPDFEINFPITYDKNISTLYLTGQNGTGKSNLLELLSEIFYYLDSLHLEHGSDFWHGNINFAFEIEYKLKIHAGHLANNFFKKYFQRENEANWLHILIIKEWDTIPVYQIVAPKGRNLIIDDKDYEGNELITHHILPQKVIGYSSGQNELLSNSFLKMRYHYFNEYLEKISLSEEYDESENNSQTDHSSNFIADGKLVLLDYRNNASVFIANSLMAKIPKTEGGRFVFEELLNISGLYSFRISINFKSATDSDEIESIKLRPELIGFIDKLKRCTPFFIDNENELDKNEKHKRKITLDFFVDDATRQAFAIEFPDASKLFQLFYEMEILNIYAQPEYIRKTVLNAPKDLNISDEIPAINPEKLIFNISDVNVTKSDLDYPIKYKCLSDGEHQFLQVIGALLMMQDDNFLFLLDEPGTHLNPAWAIQYFKYIDMCELEHGSSQIILTTHNPLMITALYKNQVLFLTQDKDTKRIVPNEIYFNPRSMSVGGLLTSDLFKLRTSLGLPTQELLDERRKITAKDVRLTPNERNRLEKINSELDAIDFTDSIRDPLYEKFKKEWTTVSVQPATS